VRQPNGFGAASRLLLSKTAGMRTPSARSDHQSGTTRCARSRRKLIEIDSRQEKRLRRQFVTAES